MDRLVFICVSSILLLLQAIFLSLHLNWQWLPAYLGIIFPAAMFLCCIFRARYLGLASWTTLFVFIPVFNVIYWLYLAFWRKADKKLPPEPSEKTQSKESVSATEPPLFNEGSSPLIDKRQSKKVRHEDVVRIEPVLTETYKKTLFDLSQLSDVNADRYKLKTRTTEEVPKVSVTGAGVESQPEDVDEKSQEVQKKVDLITEPARTGSEFSPLIDQPSVSDEKEKCSGSDTDESTETISAAVIEEDKVSTDVENLPDGHQEETEGTDFVRNNASDGSEVVEEQVDPVLTGTDKKISNDALTLSSGDSEEYKVTAEDEQNVSATDLGAESRPADVDSSLQEVQEKENVVTEPVRTDADASPLNEPQSSSKEKEECAVSDTDESTETVGAAVIEEDKISAEAKDLSDEHQEETEGSNSVLDNVADSSVVVEVQASRDRESKGNQHKVDLLVRNSPENLIYLRQEQSHDEDTHIENALRQEQPAPLEENTSKFPTVMWEFNQRVDWSDSLSVSPHCSEKQGEDLHNRKLKRQYLLSEFKISDVLWEFEQPQVEKKQEITAGEVPIVESELIEDWEQCSDGEACTESWLIEENNERLEDEDRLYRKYAASFRRRKKDYAGCIRSYLRKNQITKLYHFTDENNLESIERMGGLFSWEYLRRSGIHYEGGGNEESRNNDERLGYSNYVRVSFCSDHPMAYRLKLEGRKLYWLEIDPEVLCQEGVLFSDVNATASFATILSGIDGLKNIDLDATRKTYVSRSDPDFAKHQAEALIPEKIPLKYIKNLPEHGIDIPF